MNEYVVKPININNDSTFFSRMKVDPNSKLARIFLAFLTTAGIYYINIMPAVINGLKDGLNFTNQQAGFVSSANLYGAAIGALAAVFIIKKIDWRVWAYTLLIMLVSIDLSSIFIENPLVMISVRAIHGLVGGVLVGIGFAIISRTSQPDKTFGYLVLIQWSLGGLGIIYLPSLVPTFGTAALFVSLVIFTLTALIMLPFLPNYLISTAEHEKNKNTTVKRIPLMLNLFGIFLFQGANMGLFAYMISLGKADGLDIEFMSLSLGASSWIALFGALLVIIIGTKYGRTVPLVIAILITAFCSWLLHFSANEYVYLIANIIIGITWAFVLPYLFGICSQLDKAGQLAAMGGFASKMGMASGPMIAALLLGNDNYGQVIDVSVIMLIICAVVIFKPARLLDTHNSAAKR